MKRKTMTKKTAATLLLLTAILGVVWTMGMLSLNYRTKEFDMHLEVSDMVGFNVDTDALYFGAGPPGSVHLRDIRVWNDEDVTEIVKIKTEGELAKYVRIEESKFELTPNETRRITLTAIVPGNAQNGTKYAGKVIIQTRAYLTEKIMKTLSGISQRGSGMAVATGEVRVYAPGALLNASTEEHHYEIISMETTTTTPILSIVIVINSTGHRPVQNITISSDRDWIVFNDTVFEDMPNGSWTKIRVYLGPLEDVGTYEGNISFTTWNGGNPSIPVTVTVSEPPPTPGGGGAGASTGAVTPTSRIQIAEYSTLIKMSVGGTISGVVKIENRGDTALTGVMAYFEGMPFDVDITPEVIDSLAVGKSAVFFYTIKVPEGTKTGEYEGTIVIASDETETDRNVVVLVAKAPIPAKPGAEMQINESAAILRDDISSLAKAIEDIKKEITEAKKKGIDTTKAEEALQKAQDELEAAEIILEKGYYAEAKRYTEASREYLKKAVAALPHIPLKEFITKSLVALIIVVAIIGILTFFVMRTMLEPVIKKK